MTVVIYRKLSIGRGGWLSPMNYGSMRCCGISLKIIMSQEKKNGYFGRCLRI